MYIDTLIQGMPDSSVEKVTDCFQKLETNNYISTQEAKDAYEICKNHHSYLSDDDAKMGLIRLCAKAWEFNDIEMRALEHIRQRRETLQNLSEPQYYASIVNIAQKINFQYDYFRPISEINQTFNELSNDRDLRTLLDINRYLNLSEPLMTELCKAQCQQNFAGNSQTDELIQRIDQAGKLSELPETAFDNLIQHSGKKIQLSENSIEILSEMEKNPNNKNEGLISKLYNALTRKEDYQYLPQKSKGWLQDMHQKVNEANMEGYFDDIRDIKSLSNVPCEYETILLKVEGENYTPNEAELQKLDILHDELKKYGKLDAMPNRSQAFLENYQTEQELKKKVPSNGQNLIDKLKNKEKLTVFQAFYLKRYLSSKQKETHPIYGVTDFYKEITEKLKDLPQDVRDKASEVQELIDPKTLEVIDQVIEQIRAEENRLSNAEFYVPELDAYLKLTSEFMEIRVTRAAERGQIDEVIGNFIEKPTDNIAVALEKFSFRFHTAVDYTANGDNDGTIRYIPDTQINPTLAKIYGVKLAKWNGRDVKNITILEYNADNGLLLTSFKHTQIEADYAVEAGDNVSSNDKIGTYKIPNTDDKEHTHIEKRLVKKENFNKLIIDKIEIDLEAFKKSNNSSAPTIDAVAQLVQSNATNEHHAVALFTPNSSLSNQLLAKVKEKWLGRVAEWANDGIIKTASNFYDLIEDGPLRDKLKLETIIDMLLKMKILLAEVGETNSKLDELIHKAQKTVIDLRETYTDKKIKTILKDS